MPYATTEQFLAKYGHMEVIRLLASLEPDASRDPAVLDALIAGDPPVGADQEALASGLTRLATGLDEQSDLADSYIASVADLPLSTAVIDSSPLPGYVCDMARYSIAERPGMRTAESTDDYEAAIAWLTKLAGGKVRLVGLPEEDTGGQGAMASGSKTLTFTDDLWDTYIQP